VLLCVFLVLDRKAGAENSFLDKTTDEWRRALQEKEWGAPQALSRGGDSSIPVLADLVLDRDLAVRRDALTALMWMDPCPVAIQPALEELLDSETDEKALWLTCGMLRKLDRAALKAKLQAMQQAGRLTEEKVRFYSDDR